MLLLRGPGALGAGVLVGWGRQVGEGGRCERRRRRRTAPTRKPSAGMNVQRRPGTAA